jgi:hypothetical protein
MWTDPLRPAIDRDKGIRDGKRARKRRAPGRSSTRPARFEQLEDRLLLSAKPTGLDFLVYNDPSWHQDDAAVAVAGNGDFTVVWEAGNVIYYKMYYANGGAKPGFATPQAVATGDFDYDPDVAMAADGRFVVVWVRHSSGDDDVFFQRFNSAGTKLGSATQVNTTDAGVYQGYPAVAMRDNGNFVVVFQHLFTTTPNNDWDVRYRYFDSSGTPLSQGGTTNDRTVSASSSNNETQPDVAVECDSGNFAVVWTEEPCTLGDRDVYYRVYNSTGGDIKTRTQANTTDGDLAQDDPAVAMDEVGWFVIAWTHAYSTTDDDIYMQQFWEDGRKLAAETVVAATGTNEHFPSVAMSYDQIVVAFQDEADGDVFYRQYSNDYNVTPRGWRMGIQNNRAVPQQTMKYPSVAMNARGEFAVAFVHDPATGLDKVRARNFRHGVDTIGLYSPSGGFHLKNNFVSGGAPSVFLQWGWGTNAGWLPIAGDWDGDGVDTIGLYSPNGGFHLKNDFSSGGAPDIFLQWGWGTAAGWLPIAGDWDGDGVDTVGLYSPNGGFHLKNSFTSGGAPDVFLQWGWGTSQNWLPIAGDWDGEGVDTVGLYSPSGGFHLKNNFSSGGAPSIFLQWGWGTNYGWLPIAGDWNRDGVDTIGLYSPSGGFHLKNNFTSGGAASIFLQWGWGTSQNWLPIASDWNSPAGAPLRAADGPASSLRQGVAPLTERQLGPIVTEAISSWAQPGLAAAYLDYLATAEFVITDLPGSLLGLARGETIYLDRDAAGYGWFIDLTPDLSEEFGLDGLTGRLVAISPAAVDRIDLLTVVEHELGHVLGLEDLDSSVESLMSGTLPTGVRRGLSAAELDALFATL